MAKWVLALFTGYFIHSFQAAVNRTSEEDLELEAQDPQFHIRQGISTSVSWSQWITQFALWIASVVTWFPATVSMSKANKEIDSVKYLKGDIINNELLANMEITLIKKGSRSTRT